MPTSDTPLINEEADRLLGRLILRFGLLTLAVLTVVSTIMIPLNASFGIYYQKHQWGNVARVLAIDFLGVLVILIPFFFGINRVFAARLRLGRSFVAGRRWQEAAASLEPFAGAGQRFLDSTGEAHVLLVQAWTGLGDRQKAEKARAFVLRHRPGPWADKLKTPAAPRASATRQRSSATPESPRIRQGGQEKRSPPSNKGRRRRF